MTGTVSIVEGFRAHICSAFYLPRSRMTVLCPNHGKNKNVPVYTISPAFVTNAQTISSHCHYKVRISIYGNNCLERSFEFSISARFSPVMSNGNSILEKCKNPCPMTSL